MANSVKPISELNKSEIIRLIEKLRMRLDYLEDPANDPTDSNNQNQTQAEMEEDENSELEEISTDERQQASTGRKRQLNDDEEFQLPKKSSRYQSLSQPITSYITTKNKYSVLNITTDDFKNNDNETSIEQQKNNTTPLVIKNKEKWTDISNNLKSKKINYSKATASKEGIRVQPSTTVDFRAMYKALKELQIEFYTYQLKEEKPLKIVIKGLPLEIKYEIIKQDLLDQEYPIERLIRMKGKNGETSTLILIEINRKYKSIYNIKSILGLNIKIEPLRFKGENVQCHRCQRFGHVQKYCHNQFKCMRCAGEHSSHECKKDKTSSPKCANCGGEHVSMWKNCPSKPQNIQLKTWNKIETTETPNLKDIQHEQMQHRIQITKEKTNKTPSPSNGNQKHKQVALELAEMLVTFNETNPTKDERTKVTDHIFNILKLV